MSRAIAAHNTVAENWHDRSSELAAWAILNLVKRDDVWGGYLPEALRTEDQKTLTKPAKADRGKKRLCQKFIEAHFNDRDGGDVIGFHAIGADERCRWIGIDIDNHGTADPDANRKYAIHLYDKLKAISFSVLLIDSNGNGGFHLLILFVGSIPSRHAHHFAKWIVRDHAQFGLRQMPEVFPKQPDLSEVEYGNWMRCAGRHHSRPVWSKVWTGESFVEGNHAINIILETTGNDPELIPADAAPPRKLPCATRATPTRTADTDTSAVRRAAAYIAKMPASVSGERGHDRLLHAACVALRFGLSDSDALDILHRFNARCQPPWNDRDIARKLSEAHKKTAGEFGLMLDKDRPAQRRQRRHPRFRMLASIGGED
jgi:hypothetical protein